MTTILILEGQSPELVASGRRSAEAFIDAFAQIDPGLQIRVLEPYVRAITPADFEGVDGVVFTGSGVSWRPDEPQAAAQQEAMGVALATGLPIWGSCNGLQLAAAVLGGEVRQSPNGLEVGLARNTQLTEVGRAHPMMAGRSDCFAIPCVHRDEVSRLPEGAVLIATNGHSEVQAFAFDKDGVDFWGTQYHPELTPLHVSNYLRIRDGIFAGKAEMIDDLDKAETDEAAAARLGTTCAALTADQRTLELRNWLLHVRTRRIDRHADAIERIKSRFPGAATFEFGDNRLLCDELLALVRSGKKRATCGALRDYLSGGEALPEVGRCDIALDWDGLPALVIRTTEVSVRRFNEVDECFALAEGEDESLKGWQDGHRRYFTRNGGWSEDMELVCERFEVVEDLGEMTKG